MSKTLKSAIATLAKTLQEREALEAPIKPTLDKLNKRISNIEEFVQQNAKSEKPELLDSVPEIVAEQMPFLAWLAQPKSIGQCIDTSLKIKNETIPQLEATVEARIKQLKSELELLEGYALTELTNSNVSSIKTSNGRVESRVQTRYTVADKRLLVEDALAEGYESELTISIRPNSKLMAKIVEERGELAPGISCSKSMQAVFVKS